MGGQRDHAGGRVRSREDGRGRRDYSGGITLDHEDPLRIYLSRQVGAGAGRWRRWTTANNGVSWSPATALTSAGGKNVRPVSPRGMAATRGRHERDLDDRRLLELRGPTTPPSMPARRSRRTRRRSRTPSRTSGAGRANAGGAPSGPRGARDPDGSIAGYAWDFDADGTTDATGPEPTHTYTASGALFPDAHGDRRQRRRPARLVDEILVGLPVAPAAHTRWRRPASRSTGPWTRRTSPRVGGSSTGRRMSTAR